MTEITDWHPLALRLLLSLVAGFVIGYDRREHGQPAGLRTTILVCLAAAIAMMQANLLLGTRGRAPDSYVVFDLMRFPLGILTGVGFLGAGAIFRQDKIVHGVTTAATLWFVTVIGLCLGGGQIELGIVGTAIGLAVLWGLKAIELYLPEEKTAQLVIVTKSDGIATEEIRSRLQGSSIRIAMFGETIGGGQRTMRFQVCWRSLPRDTAMPGVVNDLAKTDGVEQVQWNP